MLRRCTRSYVIVSSERKKKSCIIVNRPIVTPNFYLISEQGDLIGQLQVASDLQCLLARFYAHHVGARKVSRTAAETFALPPILFGFVDDRDLVTGPRRRTMSVTFSRSFLVTFFPSLFLSAPHPITPLPSSPIPPRPSKKSFRSYGEKFDAAVGGKCEVWGE